MEHILLTSSSAVPWGSPGMHWFKEWISLKVCLSVCTDDQATHLSHWELWLLLKLMSSPWHGFSMTLHHSHRQFPSMVQELAQDHPVLKTEFDSMDMAKPYQVDQGAENGQGTVWFTDTAMNFFMLPLLVVALLDMSILVSWGLYPAKASVCIVLAVSERAKPLSTLVLWSVCIVMAIYKHHQAVCFFLTPTCCQEIN